MALNLSAAAAAQQQRETDKLGRGQAGLRPSRFRLAWQALSLAALLLLLMLGQLAWRSWTDDLGVEQVALEHHARINALPVALALRDARRLAEALDARLPAAQAPGPAEVRQELAARFYGGEIADWVSGDGSWRALSSSARGFDARGWQAQTARIRESRRQVVGWAYLRDGAWYLPVFYRRADASLIVVSLPTTALFAQWTPPNLPGESPLGMRGADDRILWRQPFTASMLGADAAKSPSAQAIHSAAAASKPSGSVVVPATETDQVLRLIAWADVPGSDVRVLVATARANIAQRWLAGAGQNFGLMVALLLAGFAVTAGLLRKLERAASAERQLQRAAQRQGDLVRQALDASRDATWQLDRDSGHLHFDSDLRPLLGLPTASTAPIRDLDALLPTIVLADLPGLLEALAATRYKGVALYQVVRTQAGDGTLRHFLLKGAPASEPDLAVGTLRDITRLTQSQALAVRNLDTLQRMCRLARIDPWTADPATGRIEIGPGTREIYGLPPGADAGLWLEFAGCDAAQRDTLQAARQRLLSEGIGYDLVLPITTAGGTQRWVRSTAAAHWQDGQIDRIDGALQEVTALVEAERRIDSTESRLRELALVVQRSSQMLLVTDPDERIVWCNATFERVSGYTLAEIQGQRPGPLLQHGEVGPAMRQRMRRCIDNREPLTGVRLKNFSKSGQPYWIDLQVAPVFAPDGRLESLIGLQNDVTADIEREQALLQSQSRYELATRNARIGVWEFNFEGAQQNWNAAMYELAGFDPLAGQPSQELIDARIHADDAARVMPSLLSAAQSATDVQWHCEFRWYAAEGAVRWMRAQCQFERDARGQALRGVGTMIDITAERTLSEARQARVEADARDIAKTAFISSMSHELRTPLNAVLGYAQLLLAKPPQNPAAVREQVQRIETAGWHLLALIDDILDLARVEAGNVATHVEPVHVGEVVADAVDLITPAAQARGIELDTDLHEAWALADRKQLRQVMANLLSNAVKYNRDGGKVRVRVLATPEHAVLEVQDSGLGMTAEQLAALYEPFNRLGREHSPVQGTGIGLTITRALVQQMGGAIAVSSQPDEGTQFTVKLPRAEPVASTHGPAAVSEATTPAPRALSILCVEDNPVNALLFEESLRMLQPSWRVRTANSAAEATRALQEARCDLVFLDMHLPDKSGLAWLDEARHAGLVEASQVVTITADALPQARQRAQAAGIRHHLNKPFRMAELRTLLTRLATP